MIDVHCHAEHNAAFIRFQHAHHIQSILNCDSPAEFAFNQYYAGDGQRLSCGIHPWHADQPITDEALYQFLSSALVIGEIGLDRVWTTVPLAVQRPIFLKQLSLAQRMHKPVIIHTKGCEAEVLKIIQQYPDLHILVHWYSSPDYQEAYLALPNVYFSIGPDFDTDSAVMALARKVPVDRLFVESDGIASIAWARHQETVSLNDYETTLRKSYRQLAVSHGMTMTSFETQIGMTLTEFLNRD